MADSNIVSIKSVTGRYGTYVIGDRLGGGGNGDVYSVQIQNKSPDILKAEGYAIKILKPENKNNRCEWQKREERFKRESEFVSSMLTDITGIIPIIDSSYKNTQATHSCQWYLMPQAERYNFKEYTIEERLKHMLEIATTILELHKLKISHRDIKPDNMLLYKGRLCLTDLGLIWSEDFEMQITGEKEAIGPAAIRPPELESPVNQDGSMFLKSDVYLLAKTIWIILTGIRKGYYKRYSRIDNDVYLKSMIETSFTLEPLHKLMEEATFDDYSRRISIDECIKLLQTQIAIFEGKIADKDLAGFKYEEALKRAQGYVNPDEIIIANDMEIQKLLDSMSTNSEIIISESGMNNAIGMLRAVNYVGGNVYEFVIENAMGVSKSIKKKYYFKLKDIHFNVNKKLVANTDCFDDASKYNMPICRRLNTIFSINSEKICIDGKFELNIVP